MARKPETYVLFVHPSMEADLRADLAIEKLVRELRVTVIGEDLMRVLGIPDNPAVAKQRGKAVRALLRTPDAIK